MRTTTAHCTRLELFGDRVRARFDCGLVLRPGQFLLARLAPVYDPYLRQTIFPSHISQAGFAVDLPESNPGLSFITPGTILDVMGPSGAAPPEIAARTRVLLIAHDPSALLPFAARAIDSGGAATLILSDPYPLEALDPQIELRVGDLASLAAEFAPASDRVFINTTAQLRKTLHQTLAGSGGLLAFSPGGAHALCSLPAPCGTGACGACYVKTARGHRLACLDGPFFSLSELE